MLNEAITYFRQLHSDIRARVSNWLVRREVTKVLRVTHAQELSVAPRNEWPLIMQHQREEIQAVASGKVIDIVDRRTWQYAYLPESLHRLNQPLLKATPFNIRRFSETPIPRRAINLIKNTVLSFKWKVKRVDNKSEATPDQEQRIQIATEALKRPNNEDSFRDWLEAVVEDFLIVGAGCSEHRLTPYYQRPFKAWAVDATTIRIFMDWAESTPDRPKYAQMTGLKGERGIVTFLSNELLYIRDSIRSNTPFGLGKLEVAFQAVNSFLTVQDMAGRAGADQVHKTFMWWENPINPSHLQVIRRYLQNDIEGQAKISTISGSKKPDVIDIKAVTPEDLLLDWQEFLIRIIASAFDISPMSLGLERDVNRATAEVMTYSDFRNAVVPTATKIQQAITHGILHNLLGWTDLEFEFIGLDDPDSMTKVMLQARRYMMDSVTSDEIREDQGLPPIPGGWGKLTQMQKMAVIQTNIAKITGKASSGMGSGMGSSSGMGGGMGSSGMGSMGVGSGMGSMGSMRMSAFDVAQMTPEEIEMYQQLGMLPPTQQLGQQMEQEAPGILEVISEELQRFFDDAKQHEEEMEVQPAEITPALERQQQQKFNEAEHVESYQERAINRRNNFGPGLDNKVTSGKSPIRGKYPKNPDGSFRELPKGNYDPGKSPKNKRRM